LRARERPEHRIGGGRSGRDHDERDRDEEGEHERSQRTDRFSHEASLLTPTYRLHAVLFREIRTKNHGITRRRRSGSTLHHHHPIDATRDATPRIAVDPAPRIDSPPAAGARERDVARPVAVLER